MDSGEPPDTPAPEKPLLPVLVILHQESSTPGHVGRLLALRGHPLDIRRPRYGDPLPETLAGHAGTVIFGGPMSANDPDVFVKREIALIELALREQAPYLGICLGAQMLAACLGSRVAPHPEGHVEMGYYDIAPLAAADGFGGPWPSRVYQWHSEGFDLPAGAEALAVAAGPFPNQAMRVGPAAVGFQFHPEITLAMAARWSARHEQRLAERQGAKLRHEHIGEHVSAAPAVLRWLPAFLEAWINSGRRLEMREERVRNLRFRNT